MAHPRAFDVNAIDDVARAQGGIVTYRQLVALGMSSASISRWTRTGGIWQRVLPGTYLIHRGTPTVAERLHAGVKYAGPEAVITGGLALHLRRLRYLPLAVEELPVHVLLPMNRHVKSSGFAIIERTQRLPISEVIGGFPVAPLPRSIFDAARRHNDRAAVRAFLLEAVQRRMLDIPDLVAEIDDGQRRWTATLRDVLGDAVSGVRSVQEANLRDIVIASDLPEPLWNPTLETLDGDFIAEPEGYFEDIGLALEVDSREHHYTREDNFSKTWSRHSVYNRHRIVAERILPVTIREDPRSVIAAIKATRMANAHRVPPNVRVIPTATRRKQAG